MFHRSGIATLIINENQHIIPSDLPATTSLNVYLRNHVGFRDVKAMCHEGGCGACIVSARALHPVSGKMVHFAVNSCLISVFSCHGWEITTVSGLGNKKMGYHALQVTLAKFHGTQCGYCSPGMVMNMNSLLKNNETVTMLEVENSFGGNICRCTGYRPIMDAFKTMASDADRNLCEKFQDIEELANLKMCPKSGTTYFGSYKISQLSNFFKVDANGSTWYKVVSINNIIDILREHQGLSYMIIAGNTGNGVYRIKKNPKIYIDVNGVAELRRHLVNNNIVLGANVTLTEAMNYLTRYAKINEFKYVTELVNHIDLIANVPVRNVGTIAGNLMLKHKHREFPSDIFLILETVGAKLTIMDVSGGRTAVTISGFLNLDMMNKIIISVSLPSITGNYALKSFKIMIRAQNAHAYVNAGFYMKFNGKTGTVEQATIVFGGINPSFIHATKTERILLGMNLFDNSILRSTMDALNIELEPDFVLPDASPSYRKGLALSLFYKFILKTCPPKLISTINVSGGELLSRGLSSGSQKYETNEVNWPLQKPIPKIEGLVQCSGEAQYIGDIPPFSDELYAALVLSTKSSTSIAEIDPSRALAMSGVKAFFSAKDIPGKNIFVNMTMLMASQYEELFCDEKVKYFGQPIGVIVADSQILANSSVKLVRVEYVEEKSEKPKINVREILESGQKDRIKCKITVESKERGNDLAYAIKGSLDLGTQYHYTMETLLAICVPIEDGMDVYSSTQWIDAVQIAVSDVLNIAANRINMNVRRLGGGYGIKISRSNQVAAACALAAHLLQKPVRMILSMEDTMTAFGKRYGCVNDYEVGVDKQGKIQYLTNNFYEDHGCSENESVLPFAMGIINNCYEMSRWNIKAHSVITDTPSNTFCRAPGSPEAIAMIENIMEHIAFITGLDPLKVRLANMKKENNLVMDIIKDFRTKTDYEKRKSEIDEFNKKNRWRKRGISIVPMLYPLGYLGNFPAMVCVYHGDGTVVVTHGGIECGQGINTKVHQVCSYTLGIPLEMVQVKPSSALTAPNAYVTGGASTSEACCFAVMEACKVILKRLAPLRQKYNNPNWKDLAVKAFEDGVDLQATFLCDTKTMVNSYDIAGLTNCEVEIDILTGNVMILRVDLLEDTGDSISPEIDVGQIEGAFVMGLGYWLNEQIIYDNVTGELMTNRTWTYKPPGVKDIPLDFRVEFIRNTNNPLGVLRSKATGEPAVCMAFSAVCAIRHALQSARTQANNNKQTEWFSLGAPTTAEHVFMNALNDYRQYKL